VTTGVSLADRPTAESIVELAVTMADVNDSRTVSIYARHLATLSSFPMGSLQADAILKEVDQCLALNLSIGKEG